MASAENNDLREDEGKSNELYIVLQFHGVYNISHAMLKICKRLLKINGLFLVQNFPKLDAHVKAKQAGKNKNIDATNYIISLIHAAMRSMVNVSHT